MISFFRAPIRNITPEAPVSVLQIYKYITSDYAKEVTERLRLMSDHAAARRFKSEMLDYVTFSGCFSSRRTGHLLEHSGFLCFDIDKIESEERLQEIKSLLINDEELHTVLCFRSPSGNGLKWVVEVPDRVWLRQTKSTDDRVQITDIITQNHKLLYERIRGYLFERYGIETDHTSDIARPCYLCYDPDAYYDPPTFKDNPASRFLKVGTLGSSVRTSIASSNLCKSDERLLTKSKQRIEKELNNQSDLCNLWETKTNKNKNNYENDIEKIVRDIEYRRLDITDDYHNWMLVAMALAGTYGSAGEGYFHRISQYSSKYDNKEAHRMYQSCLRNNNGLVGIGTIVYLMNR